jgi:hypothetical protein
MSNYDAVTTPAPAGYPTLTPSSSSVATASPVTGPDQYTNVSNADIYADPAMLAFLQSAGVQQGMDQLAVQNQQAQLARNIQASAPVYQDQVTQGLKNIADNAQNSGLYESGQRLQDQNTYQQQQSDTRNQALQGMADQSNSYDLQLAQQIAGLRQQAAQQGVQSAGNVADYSAKLGM